MKLTFHSWVYFSFFLISGTLLSYFPLSLAARLWIFALGVLIPFSTAFWIILEKRLKEPPIFFSTSTLIEKTDEPAPSLGLWFIFILLVLFTRFYQLDSIPSWPIGDEGIISTLAMSLRNQWNWTLLWTPARMEPLLIWLLGLFYRIDSPSLFSLRLFTALFSITTAFIAYFCARPFLSRMTSFIFSWFFAFSFWSFSFMRLCTPEDLIPFFEILNLGCLGYFLKSEKNEKQWLWMSALIIINILGFYSYINWIIVWFITLLVFIFLSFQKPYLIKKYSSFFLLTSLSTLPLVLSRFTPGGLTYIKSSLAIINFSHSFFDYLYNLFYDSRLSYPYGPDWGGMFDPVTGSLILIGILYSIKNLERNLFYFFGFCLFICLLPGVLTNYVELHRVTPSLPFWMLLAALGIQGLVTENIVRNKILCFAILGILSLGINVYNFVGPYCDIKRALPIRQWRAVEYGDAYKILKHQSEETGPLYVFSEFNSDYDDKTINTAVYPFDSLQNPALNNVLPQLAAIIVDVNYAPFLIKNYPGIRMKILRTDKTGTDTRPPFGLFIIPVCQIPSSVLKNWIIADKIYRSTNMTKTSANTWSQLYEHCSYIDVLNNTDPFITAVYWEKYGILNFYDGDYLSAAKAYQTAIQQGIPATQLYYGLGICLKNLNQNQEAEKAFRNATILSKETSTHIQH